METTMQMKKEMPMDTKKKVGGGQHFLHGAIAVFFGWVGLVGFSIIVTASAYALQGQL